MIARNTSVNIPIGILRSLKLTLPPVLYVFVGTNSVSDKTKSVPDPMRFPEDVLADNVTSAIPE